MSNWSRAKVSFKNIQTDLLTEALKNMGYSIDYDCHSVEGAYRFEGSRECDCGLVNIADGSPANIGLKFSRNNETKEINMEVVGDWYNKSYNDKTFTQAVKLEYTTASMNKTAKINGYKIEKAEMVGEYKRRIVYVKAA